MRRWFSLMVVQLVLALGLTTQPAFALCAGLVTLAAGHRPEIAIVELVLAIICAVFSLRRRGKD